LATSTSSRAVWANRLFRVTITMRPSEGCKFSRQSLSKGFGAIRRCGPLLAPPREPLQLVVDSLCLQYQVAVEYGRFVTVVTFPPRIASVSIVPIVSIMTTALAQIIVSIMPSGLTLGTRHYSPDSTVVITGETRVWVRFQWFS